MDQVADIREKVDIVSLISEHITLHRAGKNFHALCPFHGEKTPSFVVSPDRQIWHCFGCGKGGDCYTFLMEYEHMDFPEALRVLAKRTGIELQESIHIKATTSRKEQLYKVNALAAEFYHYVLLNHAAGEDARIYLQKRNITDKLMKTFKIGFAPGGGKTLATYLLRKKHFDVEDIYEAGLVTFRGKDVFDFFKGRIIFPLIDHRDNVIGFSGRLLDEKKDFGGKYINTRDTLIYHKREHFFGLNVTKEAIRKQNRVFLVEGEFDAMSCFREGITNVVAVKGTALTEQQVNLLARYAQRLTICFDGDSAGQEAIKRSLPIIAKKGLAATVVLIPNGKDPDESLQNNPGEFKKAIEHDLNVYDYLFEQAVKKYPLASPEGKQKTADELLPVINDIDNAIVKEHYLRKLSTAIQTTYESIQRELEKQKKQPLIKKDEAFIQPVRTREEILESYLLALLLQHPQPISSVKQIWKSLSDIIGKERAYQKLIHHLAEYTHSSDNFDHGIYSTSIPSELLEVYNTSLLFPLPVFANEEKYSEEIEKVAAELRKVYLKERIKTLTDTIRDEEKNGNEDKVLKLKEKYSKYITMLNK